MSKKAEPLNIYTDGASRGNPGDAAWAYVILNSEDEVLTQQSGYIGEATNNQAEYFAVIRALQRAVELPNTKIEVGSDSQLLVNQVTGQWKVKDSELNRLYHRVDLLVSKFDEVNFTHLPREHSIISRADELCNIRLDEIQKY